jgi:hypothetical protein
VSESSQETLRASLPLVTKRYHFKRQPSKGHGSTRVTKTPSQPSRRKAAVQAHRLKSWMDYKVLTTFLFDSMMWSKGFVNALPDKSVSKYSLFLDGSRMLERKEWLGLALAKPGSVCVHRTFWCLENAAYFPISEFYISEFLIT